MNRQELSDRTKEFALRIIKLVSSLPNTNVARTLGNQLLRSGTSIGANYREACRAGTKKHFTSILTISLREADETSYWLELLAESEIVNPKQLESLRQECSELVAIFAASVKTSRS
ncbi:MAG: four helix bundle protein [Lacipirellulaceae bacterium]